jgi:DNA invertase Pin-like site-specific DNA recombinase
MKIETAISLMRVVMEALAHRENCLKSAEKDVPEELLVAAVAALEADGRDTSETLAWLSKHGVHLPQSAQKQPPYRRRANNQVPAEVEVLIRELVAKSWSKSAISKQLKVNRRVVIRVAREAAECTAASSLIRMKTDNKSEAKTNAISN